MGKLIIDGNSVYEVDEECLKKKEKEETNEEGKKKESVGTNGKKTYFSW